MNAIPKPQFTNNNSTRLPPPFTEPFNSPFAPRCPRPAGFLPWFQSEKPVFRPRIDRVQVRPTHGFQKPWITGEILYEIRKKHSLLQRAKNEDTIVAWNEFKRQRTLVSQMLQDSKLKHELSKESFPNPKIKKFYCDSCDRGYANEKELCDHSAEHISCLIDGCLFNAHPKVVFLHRKMVHQHDAGLAKKIMSLDSPEDIKKWRAERKRNFPTAENVERRQKEAEEKQSRGELLEVKNFGKMRGGFSRNQNNLSTSSYEPRNERGRGQRGRGRKRRNRWGRGRGGRGGGQDCAPPTNPQVRQNEPIVPQDETEDDEDDVNGGLKRFKGTRADYETLELISGTQIALRSNEVETGSVATDRTNTRRDRNRKRKRAEKDKTCGVRSSDDGVNMQSEVADRISQSDRFANEHSAGVLDNSHSKVVDGISQRNGFANERQLHNKDSLGFLKNADGSQSKAADRNENKMHQSQSESAVSETCFLTSKTTPETPSKGNVVKNGDGDSAKTSQETLLHSKSVPADEMEEGEIVDSEEEGHTEVIEGNKGNGDVPQLPPGPVDKARCDDHKVPSFFTVDGDEDSDEEVTEAKKKSTAEAAAPTAVGGALASLIATYGDNSDSEPEAKDERPQQQTQPKQSPRTLRRTKRAPDMYPISKRRLTLLQKLLVDDVRKERNVILQCVHHIVKSNFFDAGNK